MGGLVTATPTVLVVGDVMDDVVVIPRGPMEVGSDTDAQIRRCPGGSGANTAAWLGALGARVRFAARAGAADVARHVESLAMLGVDARVAADEQAATGTIVVLDDATGERSMLTDRGANLHLCAADLPEALLDGIGLLHVSGYSLFEPTVREAVMGLVVAARRREVAVTVDPSSESFLRTAGAAAFLEWTGGASVVFPNLAEGRLLSGRESPDEVATSLLAHYEVVALKLGAEGALVAARDEETVRVRPLPVAVVDSTGAGDAFCAGFLAARLRGDDLAACAQAGVDAGTRAVGIVGGRPAPRDDA